MIPMGMKASFISAVLDAGYHKELGGGHYNTAALRAKVAEIQTTIPSGARSSWILYTSNHDNSTSNHFYVNRHVRTGHQLKGSVLPLEARAPKRLQRSSKA
jgi:hypothetical protein